MFSKLLDVLFFIVPDGEFPPLVDIPPESNQKQPANTGGSGKSLEDKMNEFVMDIGPVAPYKGPAIDSAAGNSGPSLDFPAIPDIPPANTAGSTGNTRNQQIGSKPGRGRGRSNKSNPGRGRGRSNK